MTIMKLEQNSPSRPYAFDVVNCVDARLEVSELPSGWFARVNGRLFSQFPSEKEELFRRLEASFNFRIASS